MDSPGRTPPSSFPSPAPLTLKIKQPHLQTEIIVSWRLTIPQDYPKVRPEHSVPLRQDNVSFLELGLLCPTVVFLNKEAFKSCSADLHTRGLCLWILEKKKETVIKLQERAVGNYNCRVWGGPASALLNAEPWPLWRWTTTKKKQKEFKSVGCISMVQEKGCWLKVYWFLATTLARDKLGDGTVRGMTKVHPSQSSLWRADTQAGGCVCGAMTQSVTSWFTDHMDKYY